VGYATIGVPIEYRNAHQFNKDYHKHLVSPRSPYYNGGKKIGYPLMKVVREPNPYESPSSASGACAVKTMQYGRR